MPIDTKIIKALRESSNSRMAEEERKNMQKWIDRALEADKEGFLSAEESQAVMNEEQVRAPEFHCKLVEFLRTTPVMNKPVDERVKFMLNAADGFCEKCVICNHGKINNEELPIETEGDIYCQNCITKRYVKCVKDIRYNERNPRRQNQENQKSAWT